MAANENPISNSPRSFTLAWKWMRYTAFLLIPLVWIHSIIQALITGGYNLSLEYVHMRWLIMGWRIYDIFLLAFAFSHGTLGLRQILLDYIHGRKAHQIINWSLLIFWLFISIIGAVAIIGGVKFPSP
jgi:succinate dehydrogenase / fumarate reductase membrane anchor subunit